MKGHSFLSNDLIDALAPSLNEIKVWWREFEVGVSAIENPGNSQNPYYVLFPMQIVTLSIAYHATRRSWLDSIFEKGLLPSSMSGGRCNRKSGDSEGNIYVCKEKGNPEDSSEEGRKTAHGWRGLLAAEQQEDVSEWTVLRVDLSEVPPKSMYRDPWSESGIVIDCAHGIPPGSIREDY